MMTKEEQRIALAKWMGWHCTEFTWFSPSGSPNARWKVTDYDSVSVSDSEILPNYPEDLNAMHEFMLALSQHKDFATLATDYHNNLWFVVLSTSSDKQICNESYRRFWIENSSASQRCEAACRTLFPERWRE